jgi:glycosyltransferase involved in cell wall biosynthesis
MTLSQARLQPDRETVLLIAHEASRTGAPIVAWNLVKDLKTRYNVVVLLRRGGRLYSAFEAEAAAVICLPDGTEDQWAEVHALAERIASTYRPKYAIASSAETRLFIAALEDSCVPVVALVHEFAEYTIPHGSLEQIYGAASEVVFPAEIVAASSIKQYPILSIRDFRIIPQGPVEVPTSTVDELEGAGEALTVHSAIFNDENDRFLVVGMGGIQIRKGVDLFIAIASLVRRQKGARTISFLWVGHGYRPDEDIAYSAFLRDQITRSKLEDQFEILDEVADLESIYDRADLFLLSSRLDPLPNVAIDAALKGLPVVCFDEASGIADLLKRDETTRDLVVPYLDCEAAARLIGELATDPIRLRSQSAVTQLLARSTFNRTQYTNAIDDLGRKASLRITQVKQDAAVIESENGFNPHLFLGEHAMFCTFNTAIIRYLNKSNLVSARGWLNGGSMLRRPLEGFHPVVYATESLSFKETTGENPLAHFLRSGRPPGRWTHPVIRPITNKPLKATGAIHAHFHYPELLGELLQRLSINSAKCDLFLTTNGTQEAAYLQDTLIRFGMKGPDVRVVPNRGRDIGPFLSELAGELQEYDLVCHVHGKRSKHVPQHGDRWRSFLLDHLIGSSFPMIDTILYSFEENPRLGLVFPEDPHLNDWNDNRLIAENLARRMGITDTLPSHFDFPMGTMFWARPAALQPLFSLKLGWDEYPIEPLANDGTLLHAIERLLPIVANSAGYQYATTYVPGSDR